MFSSWQKWLISAFALIIPKSYEKKKLNFQCFWILLDIIVDQVFMSGLGVLWENSDFSTANTRT